MTDKFIQFNDGQIDYKVKSSGEIKKSTLGDNPKLKKLFAIFNKNNDEVIDSGELGVLFGSIEKFATADGNSVFSSAEAEKFLNEKQTPNGKSLKEEGITVSDLFGFVKSVTAKEIFNSDNLQVKINTSQSTSLVTTSLAKPNPDDFGDKEVIDISYDSISDNLSNAKKILSEQMKSEGVVSKGINEAKELSGSENARSVSQAAIKREELSLTILSMARQGTLTFEKYHQLINNFLIESLPKSSEYVSDMYKNCYSNDTSSTFKLALGIKKKGKLTESDVQQAVIKKVVENLSLEQKEKIISDLLSSDDKHFEQTSKKLLQDAVEKGVQYTYTVTTQTYVETYNLQSPAPTPSKKGSSSSGKMRYSKELGGTIYIQAPNQQPYARKSQAAKPKTIKNISFSLGFNNVAPKSKTPPPKRIMTYEEAFNYERHVPYNKENILDYEQKEAHMQVVLQMYNAKVAVEAIIANAKTPLQKAQVYNPNDPSQSLYQDRQVFTPGDSQELHAGVYRALEAVFGKGNANEGLKKLGIDADFDLFTSSSTSFDLKVAEALSNYMDNNFKNVCGGKTLDELKNDLSSAYKKAYGNSNVTEVVEQYVQSQQESLGNLKMGVQTAFMLVLVAGQLCPVSAPVASILSTVGMAGSTLGSVGVSALENYTKAGGPTEADKREMLTELVQSGLLMATGMGIGRVAENVAGRVAMALSKCPKFCAFVTEVGLDASMSLLADLAITGQIDLSGEGIAQLQQLIIGILHARGAKGYFSKYKTKADVEAQVSNPVSQTQKQPKQQSQTTTNSDVAPKQPVQQTKKQGVSSQSEPNAKNSQVTSFEVKDCDGNPLNYKEQWVNGERTFFRTQGLHEIKIETIDDLLNARNITPDEKAVVERLYNHICDIGYEKYIRENPELLRGFAFAAKFKDGKLISVYEKLTPEDFKVIMAINDKYVNGQIPEHVQKLVKERLNDSIPYEIFEYFGVPESKLPEYINTKSGSKITKEQMITMLDKIGTLKDFLDMQSTPVHIKVERVNGYGVFEQIKIGDKTLAELMQDPSKRNEVLKILNGDKGVDVTYSNFVGTSMVSNYFDSDVIWHLDVPAGTKGAFLDCAVPYESRTYTEREFLIQMGATFKIKSAEFKDGKWHLNAEVDTSNVNKTKFDEPFAPKDNTGTTSKTNDNSKTDFKPISQTDTEFTRRISDEKLPDGTPRFRSYEIDQILNSHAKNPELTERLLSEKLPDGTSRFGSYDMERIVNSHAKNPELVEKLLNEKLPNGTPSYKSYEIDKILNLHTKNPELVEKLLSEKLPDGTPRFQSNVMEKIVDIHAKNPELTEKLLDEKLPDGTPRFKYVYDIEGIVTSHAKNPELVEKLLNEKLPDGRPKFKNSLDIEKIVDLHAKDPELVERLLNEKLPDGTPRLRPISMEKIVDLYAKNPEFVERLLNEKLPDGTPRFNYFNIDQILNSHAKNPKLTERLLNEKLPDGTPMFNSSDIDQIMTSHAKNPELTEKLLNEKFPDGTPRYKSFEIDRILNSHAKNPELTERLLNEKLPDGTPRFNSFAIEKILTSHAKNPKLTERLLNEKLPDGTSRFTNSFDIENIVNSQAINPKLLERLLNEKLKDGSFRFNSEAISTLIVNKDPRLLDSLLNEKLQNGEFKYSGEAISTLLDLDTKQSAIIKRSIDNIKEPILKIETGEANNITVFRIVSQNDKYAILVDETGKILKSEYAQGDNIKFTSEDKNITYGSNVERAVFGEINFEKLISSRKEIKDKNGNLIYTERYEVSKDIPNKYDIIREYPDGTKDKIGLAEKTQSGETVIEKNFVSDDGTKTNYVYMEQPDGGRISYTRITDSDGKVLLNNQTIWKKIDDNHFQTKENGQTYDIEYKEDKVVVTRSDGEKVEIKIGENAEGTEGVLSKELLPLLKKLPGSIYFDIKEYGLTKIGKEIYGVESNNAQYSHSLKSVSMSKELSGEEQIFVLLHELGHYKDAEKLINENQELKDIFEREQEAFLMNNPGQVTSATSYLVENSFADGVYGIKEMIAEVNAFLHANNTNPYIEMRGQYLQEHFPKTFAKIAQLLNSAQKTDTDISKTGQTEVSKIDSPNQEVAKARNSSSENFDRPQGLMPAGHVGPQNVNIYAPVGQMHPNAAYILNPDRFPVIQLGGKKVIDLNSPEFRKRILSMGNNESLTIGREGDIVVNDPDKLVSRQHLTVYKIHGQYRIADNASTNGSYITFIPQVRTAEITKGSMIKNIPYETKASNLPTVRVGGTDVDLSQYKGIIENLQEGQTLVLGRKQGSGIYVNDPFVSEAHLIISKVDGKIHIQDVSTNGTYVLKLNNFYQRTKSTLKDAFGIDKVKPLTPSELKFVQAFSNNPIIRAATNNPAKLKKIAQNIEKIISDRRIVSPEIASAIRNGYAYVNKQGDNVAVKCEISDNVMNDIAKLANGEDYINHFDSRTSFAEVAAQTPVGEVVNYGGSLYVHNGTTLERLNMSEKTFRELFPPVSRFTTHQGSVGTCYLVSTIEKLYSTPKGRVELYRRIGEDQNGIYTMTANSKGQKNYFTRWDRFGKHIREENGLAIIEQGYCKNERRWALNWDSTETQIMHVNAGGWAQDAVEGLIGHTPLVEKNKNNIRQYIIQYANSDDIILNTATSGHNGLSDRNALNLQYNIYANHEYSIKGYDNATDCVIISNPWNSGLNIKIPMNQFLTYFGEISIIRL